MRMSTISRKTKETDITLTLNLDGEGKGNINTGVSFFDHMLSAFAVHSGFDIDLSCCGDIETGSHHTVEDIGIVLGMAYREALGIRKDIIRYGSFTIPMDESLVSAHCDLCGRAFLVFFGNFSYHKIGDMESEMVEHFFRAFVMNAQITLHIKCQYGSSDHHKAEGMFKAFAHALSIASKQTESGRILSSKGTL